MVELMNEPAFLEYIGDRGVRSTEDAVDYLKEGPLQSYKQHGYGLYLVERKSDNQPVGVSGIKKRDYLEMPDLGYAFLKKYRGRGLATEAARAVLRHASEQCNIHRLAAITSPDNEASIRLLLNVGFAFEEKVKLPEFESHTNLYIAEI